MATGTVKLKERQIFDTPAVALTEVIIFDVPAISDVASPAHARIARFLSGARPAAASSANARGPIKAAEALVSDVRAKVSTIVSEEIERERKAGKSVGIGSSVLQGQIAVGMIAAMAQVKRRLPSQEQAAAFSVTARDAIANAAEVSASLARRSYSAAGSTLVAARSRLAPLAKFAQSKVVAAGKAHSELLYRSAKPLAMLAAGAIVTMTFVGGADAQSQMRSRMQPTQAQTDASWLSASGISAILPDMPTIEAKPVPGAVAPQQAPRSVAPPPSLPRPAGIVLKASAGFKEMAAMVATTNLEDIEAANLLIIKMEDQGLKCMETWRPGKSCRIESAGIAMDYATGNYTATLAPMRGISNAHRLVVVENGQGLKVHDSEALVDAKVFMESRIVEMARRTGEIPAEEEEDEVAPTPR